MPFPIDLFFIFWPQCRQCTKKLLPQNYGNQPTHIDFSPYMLIVFLSFPTHQGHTPHNFCKWQQCFQTPLYLTACHYMHNFLILINFISRHVRSYCHTIMWCHGGGAIMPTCLFTLNYFYFWPSGHKLHFMVMHKKVTATQLWKTISPPQLALTFWFHCLIV